MAIVTNKVDCLSSASGTWFEGCKVIMGEIVKPFLFSPTVRLDVISDNFDSAKALELQKKGLLIPLNDLREAKGNDVKNNYQTFANKTRLLVSKGIVVFMFEFEATECLVKALGSLTKKKWSMGFLDVEGKFFLDFKNGKVQGFETSLIEVDTQTIPDGGSKTSMITLEAEFTPDASTGFRERKRIVNSTDAFDIYSLKGIQDVKIENVTTTAANYTIKVVSGCDQTTPVTALSTPNFRLVDGITGLPVVAVASHLGDGVYKFTGAGVTAGAKTLQLYDSVLNLPVADVLLTDLYQSNVATVVLT